MLLQIDKLGKVAVTIEKDYWNINKDYDKLTVVEVADKFATYISRIPVPAGTELNNRKYWIPFSSLKEEIVIHYNEWINLFGGLLTSQAEVLNNIQKIINDIYTHLPKGIIFEGDIEVYDVGESATIHLTCTTTGTKPASEIKLYKNNTLIETWHNVTGFEIDETVDNDTEFRVEAVIDGWKYYGSWNVAMVYPFYIGTGTDVEDIIANEDYKHKGSEGLNGIYQVSPNDSDNIFIVAPKWVAIPEATMGGVKIPFDNATEYIIDEIVYYVYKSSNQYQQGHYSIKIGSVEYDKDSLTAELLNKVTDMSDEFANYNDRISEVERISGNREESSVAPTHMGRVTLKPNVKYPITKGWGIYSYTFDYEGDCTVDVLIYFENDKFYLPYRNVRHPKVINVISQTSFGEQKLDVGDADVNDIAEALNITEESQYLFYDDDDFVVTMPDDSKLSIADVIRNNWPLHDYTDFLDVKNLLTQSMINEPNTIYVIQYDFTLDGKEITIPEGCVLKFEGGSLSNGIIEFNNTVVKSDSKVFNDSRFVGTLSPQTLFISHFGVKADGISDDSYIINDLLSCVDGQGCVLNFDCDNDYAVGSSTNHTTINIKSNTTINFTGKGFLKLKSYSDGGQVVRIAGTDANTRIENVNINNIKIDGGGDDIIIGGNGQNGIGIGRSSNVIINGGEIKNCAVGHNEGSWIGDGGKAIQVENSAVDNCFVSNLYIHDCFRALSTRRDGSVSGPIKVIFANIHAKNCSQFMSVHQANINSNTGLEHSVILDNFIAENCGSLDGCFIFSRARNTKITNGLICGTDKIDAIFRGRFAYSDIHSIQVTQPVTSLIDLRPSTYSEDTTDPENNTIEIDAKDIFDYLLYTDNSPNKSLYESYLCLKCDSIQDRTIVNGSVFSSGKVNLNLNFNNERVYIGSASIFLVDYSANPNNLPDGILHADHRVWGDTAKRPPLNYKGALYFDETLRRLIISNGSGWIPGDEFSPGGAIASFGTSSQRPQAPSTSYGQTIFETDTKRKILWNGERWVGLDGQSLDKAVSVSSQRPVYDLKKGFACFDTELGKTIYVKAIDDSETIPVITWVDETGVDVTNITNTKGSTIVMRQLEPNLADANNGLRFLNTDYNKWYTFNGAQGHKRFEDEKGYRPGDHKGATAVRTALTASLGDYDEGYDFYDTDLNKILYFGFDGDNKVWRDATGLIV